MAENESIALAQRVCGEFGPRIETSARGARRIDSEDAELSLCGAKGHEALEASSKVNVENRVDEDSREERAGEGNEGDEADDDYLVLSEVHVACPSHHVSTVSTFAFRLPTAVATAERALRGEPGNVEGWEGSEDAERSGAAESSEGIAGEQESRGGAEGKRVAVDADGDLLVARRKRRRTGSGGGGTGGGGTDSADGQQRGEGGRVGAGCATQLPEAAVPRGRAVQAGAGVDDDQGVERSGARGKEEGDPEVGQGGGVEGGREEGADVRGGGSRWMRVVMRHSMQTTIAHVGTQVRRGAALLSCHPPTPHPPPHTLTQPLCSRFPSTVHPLLPLTPPFCSPPPPHSHSPTLSPFPLLPPPNPPCSPRQVWRASLLLADVMVACHRLLGGATLLELGAGAGGAGRRKVWRCGAYKLAKHSFTLHPFGPLLDTPPPALPPLFPALRCPTLLCMHGSRAGGHHSGALCQPRHPHRYHLPSLTTALHLPPASPAVSSPPHPSSIARPLRRVSPAVFPVSAPCPAFTRPHCHGPNAGSAASAPTSCSQHHRTHVPAAVVRRLDWRHGWPPPVVTSTSGLHKSATRSGSSSTAGKAAGKAAGREGGAQVEMGGAAGLLGGVDPFGWTEEDMKDASNATVLLAADVIYSDDITCAFFITLHSLLRCGPPKLLLLALEKRFNFSLSHLAPVANGYAVFRSHFAAQNGAPSWYSGGHCSSAQQAAQPGEASCAQAEHTGGERGTRVDGRQTVVDGRRSEGYGDGEVEGEREELLGWRMDVGQVPQHVVGWERGSDMELWVIGTPRSLPLVCAWMERGVGLSPCSPAFQNRQPDS
ncbi:unnamed protein product [Closterium sp. NIES-53]